MRMIMLYLSALLILVGCKTKKVVTENTISEIVDTTKVTTDSIHKRTTEQSTQSSVTIHTDLGYIEFVGSGGTLSIDGDKINAEGVRSYLQNKHTAQAADKSTSITIDSAATHIRQTNGLRSQETKYTKQEPQKRSARTFKWYQRIVYYIGAICCVAAIIYAIFLYLRKKS